jgi:hypothetical protein
MLMSFFFFAGTATLLVAAEAASGDERGEFVALVKELKCEKRKVEDLLAKGELWSAVHAAAERMSESITLGAFFDYCKRETQVAVLGARDRSGKESPGETCSICFFARAAVVAMCVS